MARYTLDDVAEPPNSIASPLSPTAPRPATWSDVPGNAVKDVKSNVYGLRDLGDKLADIPPAIMDRLSNGDFRGLGSDALEGARKIGDIVGNAPGAIYDRVEQLTSHPIQSFKEHPVNTALDVAPFIAPMVGGISSELSDVSRGARGVGLDAAETVGKKAITAALGPSSEAVDARLANPEAIKNALPSQALAERLPSTISKLQDQISKYDSLAWDTLSTSHDPLDGAIPKADIAKQIDALKNDYRITGGGVAGEADARAVMKLDAIKNRVLDLGQNVRGAVESQQGVPSILKNKDFISERNLKEIIQSYDHDINYNDVLASQTNKAISDTRQMVDGLLKDQNDAYKRAMIPVSERMDVLDSLPKKFNLKRGLDGSFTPGNTTTTNLETALKEKTLASRDLLKRLKGFTGEDYLKELENAKNAKQFEGGVTQGSRKVNLAGAVGGGVGAAAGFLVGHPGIGATIGGGVGAGVGAFLDKEGGRIAGNIIDWYANNRPAKLGKYYGVLTQANKLGPEYLLATHNLLEKSDPNYNAVVEKLPIPKVGKPSSKISNPVPPSGDYPISIPSMPTPSHGGSFPLTTGSPTGALKADTSPAKALSGDGGKLTRQKAKEILKEAKGNKSKARQLASSRGYEF